jgi:hypothetical protein
MTTGQVDEIQTITCTCGATCSGSIYITFQGEVSAPIAWNAVATTAEENVNTLATGTGRGESLQSKLEVDSVCPCLVWFGLVITTYSVLFSCKAMRLLRGLAISYSAGTSLCAVSSTIVTTIQFVQNAGNLPLLQFTSALSAGSSVVVSPVQDGNKENVPCNNRGLCNTALGTCTCFQPFGSSDGQGSPGDLPDCGAIQPPATLLSVTTCPSMFPSLCARS